MTLIHRKVTAATIGLLLLAGIVPTAAIITGLVLLRQTIGEVTHSTERTRLTREALELTDQSIVSFSAVVLHLSIEEREKVLQETTRLLQGFQSAFAELDSFAKQELTPAEHTELQERVTSIAHSWEEISERAKSDMTEHEKTFHFLKIFEDALLIRRILDGLEAKSSESAGGAISQSISILHQFSRSFVALILIASTIGLLAWYNLHLLARSTRRSEQELRLRDERLYTQNIQLTTALANMRQGLCMFDADNRVVISNERLKEIFNLPKECAEAGLTLRDLVCFMIKTNNFPEQSVDEVCQKISQRLEKGEETTFQHAVRKDKIVQTSLSRTADGGWVATFEDVTERLQLEAQLRQSQKMEAMGQLTGGIAHDFNNLLTVILGNAEVLAEELEKPAHKTLAMAIEEAAGRGAELNQRLLSFARRQSLTPEAVRLNEVVADMGSMLRRVLGEHIELRMETGARGAETITDRTLLESAILNLAVNARDAMPQGGRLTITTGERLAGQDDGELPLGQPVAFVTVADTGTGMPPDVLERAFEPFFTTKEVGKGSGLGLAMVYGFARQSAGHVTIESALGQGTSVTILLRAIPASSKVTVKKSIAPAQGGKGRILVVEDEKPVREFVRAQLRGLGYEVVDVEDGVSGLQLLKFDAAFDLLMTDVVLPKGISGIDLAHRARELMPDLKVLLTSGYSEDVFETHGRPSSDMRLLRKPYRRKELDDAVRAAIIGF